MAAPPLASASSPVAAPTVPAPVRAAAPRAATVRDRGLARHESLRADRWTANGTVKVSGGVEVGTATVTGTVSVGGGISAGAFRMRGTFEVDGPVVVRDLLFARGNLHCESTVRAGDLTLEGTGRFAGTVTVERAGTVRGTLIAPSVSAGLLELTGSATVPGAVRAAGVSADFRHRSSLGAVTARRVRLYGRVPNLVDKVFFQFEPVRVDRIEADSVELAGVDVGFVRAKEIVLGRGAHVTALEGTVVRRHPSSSVGPESKSPPPYGLRR
jgi:cytoskeletal protein CcmA (bactofilin family)